MAANSQEPTMADCLREKMRAKRKRLKITQEELANEIGATQESISQFETGRRPEISFSTGIKLMQSLGLTIADLSVEEK